MIRMRLIWFISLSSNCYDFSPLFMCECVMFISLLRSNKQTLPPTFCNLLVAVIVPFGHLINQLFVNTGFQTNDWLCYEKLVAKSCQHSNQSERCLGKNYEESYFGKIINSTKKLIFWSKPSWINILFSSQTRWIPVLNAITGWTSLCTGSRPARTPFFLPLSDCTTWFHYFSHSAKPCPDHRIMNWYAVHGSVSKSLSNLSIL